MELNVISEHYALSDGPFLVVGYYTAGTPYEQEKETLRLSLETVGYGYHFLGVENQGTWQKNTQLKAWVIRYFMDLHPNRPLLYLDVDSVMVQKPVLLHNIKADIAAVHFIKGNELLSGTVYFSGTPACRKVVDEWIHLNTRYPDKLPDKRLAWDQRTLELAIKKLKCTFQELPQEYTWIVELTQKHHPGLAPVIMHTRGAYRFKNIINRGVKNDDE